MATQFFNEVTLSTFVDMMVNKARLDPGIDFDDFFADCRSQMKETLRNPDCIWSDLPKWSSDMAFYEAERVIWEWYWPDEPFHFTEDILFVSEELFPTPPHYQIVRDPFVFMGGFVPRSPNYKLSSPVHRPAIPKMPRLRYTEAYEERVRAWVKKHGDRERTWEENDKLRRGGRTERLARWRIISDSDDEGE